MSLVLDPPVMGLPGIAYVGNPAFESERLRSFDAGYRHEFRKASIDVAVYRSRILGNNTTTLGSLIRDSRGLLFLPFQPTNAQVSDGAGVEAATTWQPLRSWNVQFNYAHQHRTFSGPSSEALIVAGGSHSPHQATAISDWQLHPRVAWQHVLYAVAAARPVPGYTRLDSSLSFRVTSSVRLQVGGENLLSPRHLEYLAEDGTLPGLMRRGLFVRAVWTR
jgi:outer membrane receptor protein involved in Fe transport